MMDTIGLTMANLNLYLEIRRIIGKNPIIEKVITFCKSNNKGKIIFFSFETGDNSQIN